jgi:hypothetical protein
MKVVSHTKQFHFLFSCLIVTYYHLFSPVWSSRSPPPLFCKNLNSQRNNSGLRWIQYYRHNPVMCVWHQPCVLNDNTLHITNKIGAYYFFLPMCNAVGCRLFETHSWIPFAWFHFWGKDSSRSKRTVLWTLGEWEEICKHSIDEDWPSLGM